MVPCQVGVSIERLTAQLLASAEGGRGRERANKTKVAVFVTESEVTPLHHCGYIPCLRSDSLGPAHTQEWGFIQSCDFPESRLPSPFIQTPQRSMTAGTSPAFFTSICWHLRHRCSMHIFNGVNKVNHKPQELQVLPCRIHAR